MLQAEAGIGGWSVPGVQSCALPISDWLHSESISPPRARASRSLDSEWSESGTISASMLAPTTSAVEYPNRVSKAGFTRAEERRVGKGWVAGREAAHCE